jgi:hypothetical protein
MGYKILVISSSLTAGNFLYELLTGRNDFGRAFEHSYFQAWALLLAYSL